MTFKKTMVAASPSDAKGADLGGREPIVDRTRKLLRVALIDDEVGVVRTLTTFLKKIANVVNRGATLDAEEAFELIQREKPDVVVTDLSFGHKIAGAILAEMIKTSDDPKIRAIKIVLLSATINDLNTLAPAKIQYFDRIISKSGDQSTYPEVVHYIEELSKE